MLLGHTSVMLPALLADVNAATGVGLDVEARCPGAGGWMCDWPGGRSTCRAGTAAPGALDKRLPMHTLRDPSVRRQPAGT